MKAHTWILTVIFFGQISKIEGFPSDDEDLSIEGSGFGSGSGSGSGCFQIPTDGHCTCNTLFDCLRTCSDTDCDLALEDCLGDAVYGNCKSQLDSDEKSEAVNEETLVVIVGSVMSAIFLTATIIIFALRNKECSCTRAGERDNGSRDAVVSKPQLPNRNRKTTKPLMNPIGIKENSRKNEQARPYIVSRLTPKSVASETSTSENDYQEINDINYSASDYDYQEMPDTNWLQNGRKSNMSPTVSNGSSKRRKKTDEEDHNIQDTDKDYQHINLSIPPYLLQTATEGQRVDSNDPMSDCQPMGVTSSDVTVHIPMAESGVSKVGEEQPIMGDSNDRTSNVYVNSKLKDNLCNNETVAQPVADYINVSGKSSGSITEVTSALEDEVFEDIDN